MQSCVRCMNYIDLKRLISSRNPGCVTSYPAEKADVGAFMFKFKGENLIVFGG